MDLTVYFKQFWLNAEIVLIKVVVFVAPNLIEQGLFVIDKVGCLLESLVDGLFSHQLSVKFAAECVDEIESERHQIVELNASNIDFGCFIAILLNFVPLLFTIDLECEYVRDSQIYKLLPDFDTVRYGNSDNVYEEFLLARLRVNVLTVGFEQVVEVVDVNPLTDAILTFDAQIVRAD